jgi:hypothetical protein
MRKIFGIMYVCVLFFLPGGPSRPGAGSHFVCFFCFLQVTASAAWEASRTPAQILRRAEQKFDRSRLFHAQGAVMQPRGMDAPTREDRACPGCRGYASYKCERAIKHCARCCGNADRRGLCPYHQRVEADMRMIAMARQAEAAAGAHSPWGA